MNTEASKLFQQAIDLATNELESENTRLKQEAQLLRSENEYLRAKLEAVWSLVQKWKVGDDGPIPAAAPTPEQSTEDDEDDEIKQEFDPDNDGKDADEAHDADIPKLQLLLDEAYDDDDREAIRSLCTFADEPEQKAVRDLVLAMPGNDPKWKRGDQLKLSDPRFPSDFLFKAYVVYTYRKNPGISPDELDRNVRKFLADVTRRKGDIKNVSFADACDKIVKELLV